MCTVCGNVIVMQYESSYLQPEDWTLLTSNETLIELFKRGINLEESLFMTSFIKTVLNHKGILFVNTEHRALVSIVKCHGLSCLQDSSNVRWRVRSRRRGED